MPPKLSICIPAYNRPTELLELLSSIAQQPEREWWDIVIAEDHSPGRIEIGEAVRLFAAAHVDLRVTYESNATTLGYDANLRRLLDLATGDYCMFMGDDDVLPPGALSTVVRAIAASSAGVLLRAWRGVDKTTGQTLDEHRYFDGDRVFAPGPATIAAFFRRCVFISGLIFKREPARQLHTSRFDGTLLYQLYLAGNLLATWPGYYISDVTAVRRIGGEHFFGSSATESGRFSPGALTAQHSLTFLSGLFDIARAIDQEAAPGAYALVVKDVARYAFPALRIQAGSCDRGEFHRYARDLARLGPGRHLLYWLYYIGLAGFGPRACDWLIRALTGLIGTPVLCGSSGARRA